MNFTHYDLKQLNAGQVVHIQLSGNAANVKLMDSINFNNYRNGRRHTYYGGYVTKTASSLSVPSHGHWHLTVDLGGHPGSVRSSINVS